MVTFDYLPEFERRAKALAKKYRSFVDDYNTFLNELERNPFSETSLGGNTYKQRLRAAQPQPPRGRRPREADAGRPRILPPPRDARPAPHTRHRAGRRGTRAARRAGGIAVQLRPAPLQGHETMPQKRFAMVRGRFAML